MKIARDFYARTPEEQEEILESTWCDNCDQSDLGMKDPMEFEDEGGIFVEGRCVNCGGPIRSVLRTK